jgi:hypothetical protein
MIRHNPENERIKHAYLDFLREAMGRDPAALDAVAMALHRFETFTGYLNFRTFDRDQAGEFKVYLASLSSAHGGSASPPQLVASHPPFRPRNASIRRRPSGRASGSRHRRAAGDGH